MAYYRQVRTRDELHAMTAEGPVVVRVKCGRACVEVEAPAAIKLSHRKRKKTLRKLPRINR